MSQPHRPARRLATLTAGLALTAGALAAAGPGVAAAAPVIGHGAFVGTRSGSAGWRSSNWSGYAETGSYHAATARWTVPAVSATSAATYSAAWVGIDGFTNTDLIQTGTASEYHGGAAHYYAWWEILPAPETTISSITVHPGDTITAAITKGTGVAWTIRLADLTTGRSFSTTQAYTGPGSSVEWIQEAPTVGGTQSTLAHYSTFAFDPGTANGADPRLTAADRGVLVQHRRQVSSPSTVDSDTDGFRVGYGAVAPAPPGS